MALPSAAHLGRFNCSRLGVVHILDAGKTELHRLNPNAQRLADDRLVYTESPPDQKELFGETE